MTAISLRGAKAICKMGQAVIGGIFQVGLNGRCQASCSARSPISTPGGGITVQPGKSKIELIDKDTWKFGSGENATIFKRQPVD